MVENALENGVRKLRKRFYQNYSVTPIQHQQGSMPLPTNGVNNSALSMASGSSLDYVMGVPPPPSMDASESPPMKKKSIGRTPSFYSTKFLMGRNDGTNEV